VMSSMPMLHGGFFLFTIVISLPAVAMSSMPMLHGGFFLFTIVISTLNACHIMMKARKKGRDNYTSRYQVWGYTIPVT
jgi:hypothetical protein